MSQHRPTNWAGNVSFSAQSIHRPTSVDQVQKLISASKRARVLGTGHSFNTVADTEGDLVSLSNLPDDIDIDTTGMSARVPGGVRYAALARYLNDAGFALPAMASLPHISVAGACATGTHGSGDRVGNLATAVSGLEMVTADGDLVDIARDDDPDRFDGMVVSLGCLGVVTSVTLDLVAAFNVRQNVFEGVSFDAFAQHLDEIFASAYSVSAFTDWRGSELNQIWVKRRDGADQPGWPESLGAEPAAGPRNPVPGMPPGNCTTQLGEPGPWHERLPHFRPEFTPSNGDELQSEYLVPRHHASAAVLALHSVRERIAPVLQICELRTVAADTLWLSPTYRRDALALHFTWVNDPDAVRNATQAVESRLRPFEPRPHWGKVFTISAEDVRSAYPRLPDFQRLAADYDPQSVFGNDFVRTYVL